MLGGLNVGWILWHSEEDKQELKNQSWMDPFDRPVNEKYAQKMAEMIDKPRMKAHAKTLGRSSVGLTVSVCLSVALLTKIKIQFTKIKIQSCA